jgi:type I restriction enzyme R subunit
MEQVAVGKVDDDTLSSLAGRIAIIDNNIDKEDREKVTEMTGGKTLSDIANDILDTIDYDKTESMSEDEILDIKDKAVEPFFEPAFRRLVLELKDKSKLYIDELTPATVISSEFSVKKAQELTTNFKAFIETNKDEIDALSIIYNKQYKERHLTYERIEDLHKKLASEMPPLETANLWRAYQLLQKDKVQNVKDPAKLLTNIVQLVRFAIGQDEKLEDFSSVANSKFELWKGRQIKRGVVFTEEQQQWLEEIKDYIVSNAYMELTDVQDYLGHKGGIIKAKQVFGQELQPILDDLSLALVG